MKFMCNRKGGNMKYKLIIENPISAHILDTKENRIVALCNTKRPDLEFGKLEELIERANNSERYKIEMEQHRSQNPVFNDGGRNEDVYVLQEENLKLRQWISDLQSGMYVNCVYCGHRYGPEGETPVSMAEVLKNHIENCPNHPMSEMKNQIKNLTAERDALAEKCGGTIPVHCGECELWGSNGWSQSQIGYCEDDNRPHKATDFCSHGKQK